MKKINEILNIKKVHHNNKVIYYWKNIKLFSRKSSASKSINKLIVQNSQIINLLNTILTVNMLAQTNSTLRIGNSLFYLPNNFLDIVQGVIASTNQYFESDLLKELEQYIPQHANILDIGANIGNHSLYWANEMNANKIIAFEPIKKIYDILLKNIEINQLGNVIECHNCGLSNCNGQATIQKSYSYNLGGTSIEKSESGDIQIKKLDDFDFNHLTKIDFVKIDVEQHEILVLEGAKETLKKFKPVIFIETFPNNKNQVFSILNELGYKLEKAFDDGIDYLFLPA